MRPMVCSVLACAAGGLFWSLPVRCQEVDDLPRDPNKFAYYQLGSHVPPRSGYPNYDGPRSIIHPNIGLPLEISPLAGEHMYCNTQVWGFKSNGRPAGKSNHPKNYTFPWTSSFCEIRWPPAPQPTRACGPSSPIAHQGSDCRPPTPHANKWWMVAVEDGKIVTAKPNLVEMVGTESNLIWKYRHGGAPAPGIVRNARVTKGTRLAQVDDLESTPIHLHLESERTGHDRDNLPSLILAYRRALNDPTTVTGSELPFDPKYEIAASSTPTACADAEHNRALASEHTAAFRSLWCHNGSIVGLVHASDGVKFVYHKPKASLFEIVKPAPVLVDATLRGATVSGSAAHYSERCAARSYQISGTKVSDKQFALAGERDIVDASCAPSGKTSEVLIFSYLREADASSLADVSADLERRSITEITRNWGAITMYVADWHDWLSYIRLWPGLKKDATGAPAGVMKDRFNGSVMAFETDEAGVGIWWYWVVVRKGFGVDGQLTFRTLARGIAGDEASEEAVANYVRAYVRHGTLYFGRTLGPDDTIALSNAEERWALAWTMFHHESGRRPLIDRATFECGVRLGGAATGAGDPEKFATIDYRQYTGACPGDAQRTVAASDVTALIARIKQLEEKTYSLSRTVTILEDKLARIRAISE